MRLTFNMKLQWGNHLFSSLNPRKVGLMVDRWGCFQDAVSRRFGQHVISSSGEKIAVLSSTTGPSHQPAGSRMRTNWILILKFTETLLTHMLTLSHSAPSHKCFPFWKQKQEVKQAPNAQNSRGWNSNVYLISSMWFKQGSGWRSNSWFTTPYNQGEI